MHIELDDIDAMEIRVALRTAALRWDEAAQAAPSYRSKSVQRIFVKKAESSFRLMNVFRVATGYEPYTIGQLRGDEDE